MKVIFYIIVSI